MKTITVRRHFKVKAPRIALLNSAEFDKWVKDYDRAEFARIPTHENEPYNMIYTSELSRSQRTAQYFMSDESISTHLLNEVPISSCFDTNAKLPLFVWLLLGRLAWLFGNHSQSESFGESVSRAKKAIRFISENDGNVLVVSHGLFMILLRMEDYKRRQ